MTGTAIHKTPIAYEGRRGTAHSHRVILTSTIGGAVPQDWVRLNLPSDGLETYIRNGGNQPLDVSFEDFPGEMTDPSFFQLAAAGTIGFDVTLPFVPADCWVRQNVANQVLFWWVKDQREFEVQRKTK